MDDGRLEDFASVRQRFVEGTFGHSSNLHELLFGVEKNNAERFAIEKTHLRTELGNGKRIFDRQRLAFLS